MSVGREPLCPRSTAPWLLAGFLPSTQAKQNRPFRPPPAVQRSLPSRDRLHFLCLFKADPSSQSVYFVLKKKYSKTYISLSLRLIGFDEGTKGQQFHDSLRPRPGLCEAACHAGVSRRALLGEGTVLLGGVNLSPRIMFRLHFYHPLPFLSPLGDKF